MNACVTVDSQLKVAFKAGRHLSPVFQQARSAMMHDWSSLLFELVFDCDHDFHDSVLWMLLLYHESLFHRCRVRDSLLHMARQLSGHCLEEPRLAVNCHQR